MHVYLKNEEVNKRTNEFVAHLDLLIYVGAAFFVGVSSIFVTKDFECFQMQGNSKEVMKGMGQ